jgi:hypothetical protein
MGLLFGAAATPLPQDSSRVAPATCVLLKNSQARA